MATCRNFKGLVYKPRAALSTSKHLPSILPSINSRAFTQSSKLTTIMSQKYIVVFKDGVTEADITKYADEVVAAGGEIKERFDLDGGILNGFAATITDSYITSLQSLTGDVISYIEPDSEVKIQA